MRPRDVRGCVEVIAEHPIVGLRYAGAIAQLADAWTRCLGSDAFHGSAFEETHGSRVRLLGAGVRAFVSDDFIREVKTPPFFWFGPEIARRVANGRSPLLSDKKVREANSSTGLNLLIWEGCVRVEDSSRSEVHREIGDALMADHRGFLIREYVVQAAVPDVLHVLTNAGASSFGHDGRYVPIAKQDIPQLFLKPHVVGCTREMAIKRMGAWLSNLFLYDPPRFEFRPSEQKLLLVALGGATDDALCDELGVSRSAIKKSWQAIYERVAARDPDLIPVVPSHEQYHAARRGKQKKHRLLAYLRDHLEELRPVSSSVFKRPEPRGRIE
jgi:hypothetical protein